MLSWVLFRSVEIITHLGKGGDVGGRREDTSGCSKELGHNVMKTNSLRRWREQGGDLPVTTLGNTPE